MDWHQPIVHFVFQTEELAERAHLSFGFTNTLAPFAISQERVGAEYRVESRYIGEAVFQPGQQLVVYYNGAPAGWLWIMPYLVAGQMSWIDGTPTRWQIQNPMAEALVENGTIPGLPISTRGNESPDALRMTIEQAYAQWSFSGTLNLEFRCNDSNGDYVTKTFTSDDVDEVEFTDSELIVHISDKWAGWFDEWDIAEVLGLSASLDEIIWDNNQIEVSFDVGD